MPGRNLEVQEKKKKQKQNKSRKRIWQDKNGIIKMGNPKECKKEEKINNCKIIIIFVMLV